MTPSAAILDRRQDPQPTDVAAELDALMREAGARWRPGKSSGRRRTVLSPMVVTTVSAMSPLTRATLLDHCSGPQAYRADGPHRRRIAALRRLDLVSFTDRSERTTRLTEHGRETCCRMLARMAESLLGRPAGVAL